MRLKQASKFSALVVGLELPDKEVEGDARLELPCFDRLIKISQTNKSLAKMLISLQTKSREKIIMQGRI